MKLAVICRLRTRSTFLLEHLCAHYSIQNLNESYFNIDTRYFGGMRYALSFGNMVAFEKNWLDYLREFRSMTDQNFQNNFGIKIFTKMLHSKPLVIYDDDFTNLRIATNLSNLTRIRDYDKIYYLTRDLYSSIYSQLYSLEIKNAIYRHNNIDKIKNKSFTVSDVYLPYIDSYIVDVVLQEKILEFLIEQNIPHTKLDYTEIPSYVNKELQGSVPDPAIDTKFDYNNLIKNINQVQDYSRQSYEKISMKLSDIKFT